MITIPVKWDLKILLSSPKLQIIADILMHLQESGKSNFWADCTEEELFPHILINKDMLMSFTKHDLDLIGNHIESFTVQNFYHQRQQGHEGHKNSISLRKW